MRTFTKFAAASVAALSLGALAAPANASVFISFDGINIAPTTPSGAASFADGPYSYTAVCGAICGGFAGIKVEGATDHLPTLLHSDTVDATTQVGANGGLSADVTIWVTRTGLLNDFNDFGSSFTANNSPSRGVTPFSVTMSTYIDFTNGMFSGDLLSTSGPMNTAGSHSINLDAFVTNPGTMYSVTEKYVIHADATSTLGSQSTSPTIILDGFAVPEPGTWALMLVGFGGAGAMLRRRRAVAAAA